MSHFGSAGPPDIRDTHSLLVLNITFRTSADDLYPLFDRYGKVVDIFIPRDRRTGESRGFAFVRYKYAEEAQKAIERLDGRNVDGRDMVVQYAKYGRDMETIHRGKITQSSPSKWRTRSRSRSPRRPSKARSPIRGKRNFGPPHPYSSPPRRDRYQGAAQPSGRYRDEYRERDYRHRSRERYDRYERSDRSERSGRSDRNRDRDRDRDHRRRSPSRSPSRSRSRSHGRSIEGKQRHSHSKVVDREVSPPVRSASRERSGSRSISRSPRNRRSEEPLNQGARNGDLSPRETKRGDSTSPKQSNVPPGRQSLSPRRKSASPAERESLSPVRSASPARSISPMQRSASRSPSPRRHGASLSPEPQSPFQD